MIETGERAPDFVLPSRGVPTRFYGIAEAEAGYTKVLKLTRHHLGDQHPLVAMQLWYLAGFYAKKKNDLASAERYSEARFAAAWARVFTAGEVEHAHAL